METEADRFAGEFLMPAKEIRASFAVVSLPKLATLKPYWKTSMGAMIEHAHRLGKISPRKRQLLWTQMSYAGYRTKEPIELDGTSETPTVLQQIITAYRQQLQYSFVELGKAVGLYEKEFRALYIDPKPKFSMVSQFTGRNIMGKNIHITHRKDDEKWAVKGEGDSRAASLHNTQRDAIESGRPLAEKNRSELVIHDRNNRIRDKDSYGNDPHPPKDKKY